jgi:muramidase (phage lysozyme)
MTLREIYAWIDATPGQHHAIGRYQFIPKTLKRLATILGADLDDTFDPQMQNALSDILLLEAGYNDVANGQISRHAFMNNLAKIWAGLPNTSGKSHYHGYAGNRASITWAEFDAEMKIIFPRSVRS